ncbi:hypothetical protein CsSME_00024985 [Camellia sinensis var. sinensis]
MLVLRSEGCKQEGAGLGCHVDLSTGLEGGDFNMVRCSEEKLGLRPAVGAMRDFSSLIDDLELIDLPMQGGAFLPSGSAKIGASCLGSLAGTFGCGGKLDAKEVAGSLTAEELTVREEVRQEYGQVAHMEEINGDRNTKYFHHMANAHRRVNQVGKLWVNRVLLSEEEVREGIVGFYQHLFRGEVGTWRPSLDGVQFDALLEADKQMLERPFSEEEVFEALQKMSGDKAPARMVLLCFSSSGVGKWSRQMSWLCLLSFISPGSLKGVLMQLL